MTTLTKAFLIVCILGTALSKQMIAQTRATDSLASTIVFVCEHGAAKSTIASAYFNKLAQERGLNYRSIFRGTSPDTILNPAAAKGLAADGFDTQAWKPSQVNIVDLKSASKVITLGCPLPDEANLNKPVTKWDETPPVNKDYDAARDYIKKKVEILVEELAKTKH
jgi:arsenate reductase